MTRNSFFEPSLYLQSLLGAFGGVTPVFAIFKMNRLLHIGHFEIYKEQPFH